MSVVFDPDNCRLRLDEPSFAALVATDRDGDSAEVAALRAAGAVQADGAVHPVLEPAVDAVTSSWCHLQVSLVDHDRTERQGFGWANGDAGVLLLPLPDDRFDLITVVPPQFLPVMLARVVRLGPRARLDRESLRLPGELLADLLSGDDTARQQARRRLIGDAGDRPEDAIVDTLASTPWRAWSLECSWPRGSGDGVSGRSLSVADTERGLYFVEHSTATAVVRPTTPTHVWQRLTMLLPTDTELNGAA